MEQIEALLNNRLLIEIEGEIARKTSNRISREDIPLLVPIYKKQIELSGFSLIDIEKYMLSNKSKIIEFGSIFLSSHSSSTFSAGISISYSIYLIFLRNHNTELLDYLKKLRIPQYQKLTEELRAIEKKIF